MGVPSRYVNWVRERMTTPMYSVAVNGGSAGYLTYFRGDKGIHCPLFFFFFVLAMEFLTQMLKKKKGFLVARTSNSIPDVRICSILIFILLE